MDGGFLYVEFGKRLRAARERANLTQDELASRVRMSRPSLANIERGNQRVALHQFVELATALGVEPSVLLPEPKGLASRLERAVREAGLPDEVADWGARALRRLEREEDGGEED